MRYLLQVVLSAVTGLAFQCSTAAPPAPASKSIPTSASASAPAPAPAPASVPTSASGAIVPDARSVLIVVDVQNCFVTGGTLPVTNGEAVVPIINRIAPAFDNVVVTQDWHTPRHASFASRHAGKKPFETTAMPYGTQVMWPDHCVQGTDDAALRKDLDLPRAQLVIRKGFHDDVDSYSAFTEADHRTTTGLAAYLKARGIRTVYMVGLATDFCVSWTAIDARKAGFESIVIEDATRAIDLNGSLAAAMASMRKAGVRIVRSDGIAPR